MIRPALLLAALSVAVASGGVAEAQEQRDVVVQVRVGADDAREWAGWSGSEYGQLLSGRLPGRLFTDGEPREPTLIRQSQSDLTTLTVGYPGEALHPTTHTDSDGDSVYDHYTVRVKDAVGEVLWEASLPDAISGITAEALHLGGLSGLDLLEHEGQRIVLQMDYPEVSRSLASVPGGPVGAQIGLIGFALVTGSLMMRGRYRGIVAIAGAIAAALIFPVIGIGDTGTRFVAGVVVVLGLAFAFLWQRMSR